MTNCLKLTLAITALSLVALAQTGTNGSASGSASATPGRANAGVSASQSAQSGGADAAVNASGSAQASLPQPDKPAQQEKHGNDARPSSNNSAPAHGASAALASGTTLQAELTKPLDARKAKPGDQVTAKLTQDVKANGKVVLHKGSKLIGHVTEAQPRSKEQKESRLGIVFDTAELKGGQEAQINAVLQALAPPVRSAAAVSGDDSGGLSTPAPMSGGGRSDGVLVGGVAGGATSTLGSATGAAGSTIGGAAGGVNSTVGSTVGGAASGLNAQGALASTSSGVIGLEGLTLSSATSAGAQGSVISSAMHNVKLDSGTQMILQVVAAPPGR